MNSIFKRLFKAKPNLLPTSSGGDTQQPQEEEEEDDEEEEEQETAETKISVENNRIAEGVKLFDVVALMGGEGSTISGSGGVTRVSVSGEDISLVVQVQGSAAAAATTTTTSTVFQETVIKEIPNTSSEVGERKNDRLLVSQPHVLEHQKSGFVNEEGGGKKEDLSAGGVEKGKQIELVQDNVFSVGDFVWAKVKNQHWWPGQIYNPLDASSFALKNQEKNHLLVAYFGDQSYTWCKPSELKPFQENFDQIIMQTKAKKFRNAVKEVLNEIGRIVESQMTCSCIPMEAQIGIVKPLAVNPGIKGGVVVPDCRINEFSKMHFEPAKFVSILRYIAEIVVSPTSMLELIVFRRQLAAFNRSRSCGQVPMNQLIPEENARSEVTSKSRQSNGQTGDPEEDWLASPTIHGISQTSKENWSQISGDKSHQKKKQRTMVDIMANDMDVEPEKGETDAAEEEDTGKSVLTSRKRKKDEVLSDSNIADGDLGSGNSVSAMVENKDTNEGTADGEGSNAKHFSRERKKSKYLSPPYTNLGKGSKQWSHSEDSVTETPKGSKGSRVGRRMKKAIDQLFGSSPLVKCSSETFHKAPPEVSFDSMISEQKKIVSKQKSDEMFYEFVTAALDPMYLKENPSCSLIKGFFSIYRSSLYHDGSNYLMFNGGMAEQCDENGNQLEADHQTSKDQELKTLQTKDERMSIPDNDLKEVNLKDEKTLRSADNVAMIIKRKYEKKMQNPNSDPNIVSTKNENLQSPNGEPLRMKRKYEKKLKSPDSEPKNTEDDKMLQSANGEAKRVKRKYEKKLKSPNCEFDHIAGTANLQPNPSKEANGQTSGAVLLLNFASGVPLPTKGDLVKEFEKFGALIESKTEVLQDSSSAQVFYRSSTDAEAAFTSSGKITRFGPPNMVSYRLQYPSTTSKGPGLNETSSHQHLPGFSEQHSNSHQATPANQTMPVPPVEVRDPLEFMKQTLQMMTSTLEMSGDKLSPDMKAKLECEIRILLQKVTKGDSSSSQ
ncbi:uncharacterized protein LOC113319616 isoform X1 [Papaver somniferum]|nr:uncharacterized protein LOC113319616 isoform X1 [Papaver somniferum]